MENNVYQKEFLPYVNKTGKLLNSIGCVLLFLPCIALFIMGFTPNWAAVLAGYISVLSGSGILYFVEPISYFTTLGVPGTYLSFLSGNIGNMRVPCALISQQAAGETPGSEKGSILATVGISVSILVSLVVLTVGVVAGSQIYAILPDGVKAAFDLLLPALFAAMAANIIVSNVKYAKIGVPLSVIVVCLLKFGVLNFIPAVVRSPLVLLVCVFGTIGICMKLEGKKEANGTEK